MKELFVQYSQYNIWANQSLLDVIHSLPEAQCYAEVPSSFGTVYKTVLHMWDAESMWWQRMKLSERIVRPSAGNVGTLKDVSGGLMQQSRQWKEWISNAQEHMLQHEFIYQNTKKESFKQPVYQVLLHIFNHGTYNRGQLINMLRQLEVSLIPATDFIVWSRKK